MLALMQRAALEFLEQPVAEVDRAVLVCARQPGAAETGMFARILKYLLNPEFWEEKTIVLLEIDAYRGHLAANHAAFKFASAKMLIPVLGHLLTNQKRLLNASTLKIQAVLMALKTAMMENVNFLLTAVGHVLPALLALMELETKENWE